MTTLAENDVTRTAICANKLKNFIERVERLEGQKIVISEDIKEVYGEASAQGFDVSTMKKVIRLRRADSKKLEEQEYLLGLYKSALGM